jgi:hypothetical protein
MSACPDLIKLRDVGRTRSVTFNPPVSPKVVEKKTERPACTQPVKKEKEKK